MFPHPSRCRWWVAGLLVLPLLLALGCTPGPSSSPRSGNTPASTESGKTQPQKSTDGGLKEPGHTPGT
jgi:hypothetical protein